MTTLQPTTSRRFGSAPFFSNNLARGSVFSCMDDMYRRGVNLVCSIDVWRLGPYNMGYHAYIPSHQ